MARGRKRALGQKRLDYDRTEKRAAMWSRIWLVFTISEVFHTINRHIANTIKGFGNNLEPSKREIQDVYIHPKGNKAPSLVVESGTILDEKDLIQDMKVWMKKGRGHVRKIILMIWIMLPGGYMGGRIEVYEHKKKNGNHTGVLTQKWVRT
jgi:hypothetical protein